MPGPRPPAPSPSRGSALLAVLWLSAASRLSLYRFPAPCGAKPNAPAFPPMERAPLPRGRGRGPRVDGTDLVCHESDLRSDSAGLRHVDYSFSSGTARVEIIPETSKLNVNLAPPAELFRLCVALGVEPRARGKSRLPSRSGATLAAPDSTIFPLTPSFLPPHASFQEIEELTACERRNAGHFLRNLRAEPEEARTAPRLVPAHGLADCLSVFGPGTAWTSNTATRRFWRPLV